MGLCLKKIEQTINLMDETYDANFGAWIKNEENCKVVGLNLKKYIEKYKTSDFITVVKWVVKDWTLKSIILFSRKLIIDDLQGRTSEEYITRIKILSGLVYTWNPIFIAEFLLATSTELTVDKRAEYFVEMLQVFESKKLAEILTQIENKTEEEVRNELVKRFKEGIYKNTKDQWKRTGSLLDAYKLS